jgi:uncharacterized protein involved in outer membrane biogenesis
MSTKSRFGLTAKILLGTVVAIGAIVLLFDWNWLRHPVEHYITGKSHREVRIGHLDVDLNLSLEPTVKVRDLHIENAEWADKRPFINAAQADFTFSLRSVWEGRPVISKLVLVDAELDMERQADGSRNYRLIHPEYRGPGKVKLQSLEAHNTTIRFVRRDVKLDMTASASPAQARGDKQPDAEHPTRVRFKGEFAGAPFEGDVDTGALLTFLDTGIDVAIRGSATAGKSRLEVDGKVADLFDPSAIDGDIHVSGTSLANLHPLLRAKLPASRPYDLKAHLKQTAENTSFAKLRAKIGGTDLAGDLTLIRGKDKPTLKVELHSESADLDDIGPLIGQPAAAPNKAAADDVEAEGEGADGKAVAKADKKDAPPKRIFSDRKFDGERLNKLDAHVGFDAKKFRASKWPALQSVRVTADLAGGVLKLSPIDLGVAGGHVTGRFTFDGNKKPLAADAKVELKGVRVEQLLAGLSKKSKAAGPLQGHVELKGQGNSIAAIAASASGPAEIDLVGGDISNLVDAGIGLNAGKAARLLITGDKIISVNDAKVAFNFDKGQGTSKSILLDTEQTHTEGQGNIDLRAETFDITLTPHPKKPGILRLHSSIRVHGPIREPKIALAKNP